MSENQRPLAVTLQVVSIVLFTFIGYHFGNALLAAIRPFFHVPHVGVELAVAIVAIGLLWLARQKR